MGIIFHPTILAFMPDIMEGIAYETERNGTQGHWQFEDKPESDIGSTTGMRRIIRSSLSGP